MSVIIGFKDSVDNYYKNQSGTNTWSSLLNSLDKTYTQSNYINQNAYNSNLQSYKNAGQDSVSALYARYKASKSALSNGSVSDTFASGVNSYLKKATKTSADSAYAGNLANAGTYTTSDYTTDDNGIYSAYQNQVSNVSNTWAGVFSYLNNSETGQSDTDYAVSNNLIKLDANGNASLTSKGAAMIKYYMNNGGYVEGDNAVQTDEYYLNKGTLNDYLSQNVDNYDSSYLNEVGSIAGKTYGNDFSSLSYDDKTASSILGTTVTSGNTVNTDWDTIPGSATALLFNSSNGSASSSSSVMKKYSDGYIDSDSNAGYILKSGQGDNVYKALGIDIDTLSFNGMSISDAIKYGVLQDGSVFKSNGLDFTIYNGELRLLADSTTMNTVKTKTNLKYIPNLQGSGRVHQSKTLFY